MADSRIYLQTQPLIPVGNHNSLPTNRSTSGTASFADILAGEQPAMRDQNPALPAFTPPHPQQFEQLRLSRRRRGRPLTSTIS